MKRKKLKLPCDRLSQLPDEIISSILSHLPVKEAIRSSVISRRWNSLGIYTIPRLVFHANRPMRGKPSRMQSFVEWVDTTLEQNQHLQIIREFTVRCDLDSMYSDTINSWLQLFMKKDILRLELSLGDYPRKENRYYIFPYPMEGFRNIRELSLANIYINEMTVDYFLSNCMFLEGLCLRNFVGPYRLNIVGENLMLKRLELENDMKRLHTAVSAPKLEYLDFNTPNSMQFESIPLLSELSIGEKGCISFLDYLNSSTRYGDIRFSKLKILKLHLGKKAMEKSNVWFPAEFSKFTELKELNVTMNAYSDVHLLWPTVLVTAAPFLDKFIVRFQRACREYPRAIGKKIRNECIKKIKRKTTEDPHERLKVVEMHGFIASKNQIEFAQHLFRIAQSLEEVFIHTPCLKARKFIEQLGKELPSNVKLITS